MELNVLNGEGKAEGKLTAADAVFARPYSEPLVHQVVTAYLANARLGTRAQKGRSDVNKSTRKPWRQKGTGRARAGMASSPLWRGGGKIFPNSPDENFSHKLNRKMYRAGMSAILSELARSGKLSVIEALRVDAPKTKTLAQKLRNFGGEGALVIDDAVERNLELSSRNLKNVRIIKASEVDPVTLMRFPSVLVTKTAVKKLEEMLS
ncbi:MAG: 50S ribosomal protein L4 [Burkholderiales bacterium]